MCHINQQKTKKTVTELFPAVAALLKQELQENLWRFYFILLYEGGDQARQWKILAWKSLKICGQDLFSLFKLWPAGWGCPQGGTPKVGATFESQGGSEQVLEVHRTPGGHGGCSPQVRREGLTPRQQHHQWAVVCPCLLWARLEGLFFCYNAPH